MVLSVSEVIPSKLYLGSMEDAKNLPMLTKLGVTHILNVTSDVENYYERKFTYMNISVGDGVEGIGKHFQRAHSFIEESDVVFVHCRHGISRSATIVISYLMKKHSWSLEKTLEFVKEKRPIVNPHFLFWVELNLSQQS